MLRLFIGTSMLGLLIAFTGAFAWYALHSDPTAASESADARRLDSKGGSTYSESHHVGDLHGYGGRLRGSTSDEAMDPPAGDGTRFTEKELLRLFAGAGVTGKQIDVLRRMSLVSSDPASAVLVDAVLARWTGDSDALERVIRAAREAPRTLASYLLHELEPDRAAALLLLDDCGTWADAISRTANERILTLLLRERAEGEERLAAAVREASQAELPHWGAVVAGFRRTPAPIGRALADLLLDGEYWQRTAVYELAKDRDLDIANLCSAVTPAIDRVVRQAADSEVPALLDLLERAGALHESIGVGLLELKVRATQEGSLSPSVSRSVLQWLDAHHPEVVDVSPKRAERLIESLAAEPVSDLIVRAMEDRSRGELILLCERVVRGGDHEDPALPATLLNVIARSDDAVAAAATSAFEGVRRWETRATESLPADLDRLLRDRRPAVRASAAHALAFLPRTDDLIREHLARLVLQPGDPAFVEALLAGLLANEDKLGLAGIGEDAIRLWIDERTQLTLATRRRIMAWMRGSAAESSLVHTAARCVFPNRSRSECPVWMADFVIRRDALAILTLLRAPRAVDAKAVLWATADPHVAARAKDILARDEWIAALEKLDVPVWRSFTAFAWDPR